MSAAVRRCQRRSLLSWLLSSGKRSRHVHSIAARAPAVLRQYANGCSSCREPGDCCGRSAWESDRNTPPEGRTCWFDCPLLTVTDPWSPNLMARQWPGDLVSPDTRRPTAVASSVVILTLKCQQLALFVPKPPRDGRMVATASGKSVPAGQRGLSPLEQPGTRLRLTTSRLLGRQLPRYLHIQADAVSDLEVEDV
jgi:hypothetical protein